MYIVLEFAALSPVFVPETETAPEPMVRTEVLSAFAVKVRAPPPTVSAVLKVAFETCPAVRLEAVPEALVRTTADGVPRSGVTKVGEVEKTRLVEVVPVVPVADDK
jgi:hypothetical protein